MTHASPTTRPDLTGYTPRQRRLASLSAEWIDATHERREQIIAEWEATDIGKVVWVGDKA